MGLGWLGLWCVAHGVAFACFEARASQAGSALAVGGGNPVGGVYQLSAGAGQIPRHPAATPYRQVVPVKCGPRQASCTHGW